MKFNILYIIFLVGLGIIIPITRDMLQHPVEFYGIADNEVRNINLQYPVEVREINIMLGQSVVKGQLLAKLYRTDLPLKINDLSYEIQELEVKKWMEIRQMKSNLAELETRATHLSSDFDNKISLMESENAAQTKILESLKTVEVEPANPGKKPNLSQQKIESARQQKLMEMEELNLKVRRLSKEIKTAEEPINLRITKLKNDLELLKKQEAELELYAPQAGIIGQLDFQPGEKVPAYSTIMKLYGQRPNVVTTYIADGRLAEINMGDSLLVNSINQPDYELIGVVIGLGTRVTQFPERLSRDPDFKIWGREVQLRIPEDNLFLKGEKVKVRMQHQKRVPNTTKPAALRQEISE